MQKIVGVKRSNDKDLYFYLQNIDDLKLGDKVVCDFDEFETVATVSKVGITEQKDRASELKSLRRIATESDISKFESLAKKAKSKLPEIKKKSLELGLMMKFISAEFSLDESKVLITFSSEERVDFRALLKELASMLKARIELKQIGQRDEVKVCGGVGSCGEPCCCARFLKSFDHVTVKMAKVQGLSLAPTKINGICGRLMCCLGYESEMYEKMLEKMPRIGSNIKTPNGMATVVYNDILRERVSLKRSNGDENFVVEDYSLEEVENFKKGIFNIPKKQEEVEKQQQEEVKENNFKKKHHEHHDRNDRNTQNNGEKLEEISLGEARADVKSLEVKDEQNDANKNQNKNFKNKKKRHHRFGPKPDFNKK